MNLNTLLEIILPVAGLAGAWYYIVYSKNKEQRARRTLRLIKLERESKEYKKRIEQGVKRARQTKKEYEDAKRRFRANNSGTHTDGGPKPSA